ncbi:MAG: hypothetical protein WKF88_05735 [Ferruginibacter sp.]
MQTITRNPQATANTNCSTFSSARKMMISLLMGVFVFLGLSFQGFSQCTLPTGSITGAANTIICAGQGGSVNINLTGDAPFNGVFNIALQSGSGSSTPAFAFTATNNGAFAVVIPAANLTNTGTNNAVYNISFTSLSNACGTGTTTGFVTITVEPVSNLTAVYNSPTQPICNGSTPNFTISNPNLVGGTYNVSATYNGVTGGAGNQTGRTYGTFTDGPLFNNTGTPQTVSYTFTPISPVL